VGHSDSLVRLVGESIAHLQATPARLDCHELFVLLAACYVHDVGMQAMPVEKALDELTPSDHDTIRREHPSVGRTLIVSRTLARDRDQFDLGLHDDEFLAPIALVSEAHGTETYASAVAALIETRPQPGGVPLRGDLLGALLLMADELDLQRARATFPNEAKLSTVSMVHHFLNHYVSGVHVCDASVPTTRRISIDFLFPEDSQPFRNDVRELIVKKLLRQSRLTNPVIARRTDGQMQWDTRVATHETLDVAGQLRHPTPEVWQHMRRSVVEGRLIGRRELLKDIKKVIDASSDLTSTSAEIVMSEGSEEETSLLIEWLQLNAAIQRRPFVHVAPDVLPAGHGPHGVLALVARQLGCINVRSHEDLTDALAMLSPLPLFVIEAVGQVKPTLAGLKKLVNAAARSAAPCVALSSRPSCGLPVIEFAPLGASEIAEHLVSAQGHTTEGANEEAKVLYLASGGRPGPIIAALHAEFEQAIVHQAL